MKQKHFLSFSLALLAFLATLVPHTVSAATAAGKVLFATGQAQAVEQSGNRRSLRRGDDIFSGDSLRTGKRSRLQVSLSDGAYISVQPDSEYKIEDYNFSGKADGTEKSYYRLLKGGIRAITGLIGKKNKDAYRVNTAVATIGIRGTGHQTRMCDGDCSGQEDGLYHVTTKGTTFAENDVDSKDVPKGQGVFVKSKDSLIQFFDQPSSNTAAQLGQEKKEEQEKEDSRSQNTFYAGEQRNNETGDQNVFTDLSTSTVKPLGVNPDGGLFDDGFALAGVSPDLAPDADPTDPVAIAQGFNASFFFNVDGEPIAGILTNGDDDENPAIRTFATIDLSAALGGDDATVVTELESLVSLADQTLIDSFLLNQATVLEFDSIGDVFWFRWGDGLILSLDQLSDGTVLTNVDELSGNQSLHVVVGPEPSGIPTLGTAIYDFAGGTQSTSVSGATIGEGVTAGFVGIDFLSSSGFLQMNVLHDSIDYLISGNLGLVASENALFDNEFGGVGVIASTNVAGSACNPDCIVELDGGFVGESFEFQSELFPKYLGFEYDIAETDEITGVAAFKLDDTTLSIVTPEQLLLQQTLTGVAVAELSPLIQIADLLVTGDPVTSISGLGQISFAPTAAGYSLTNDSAQTFETFNDGTLFVTRWSNGQVTDVFSGSPTVRNLNGDQGAHIVLTDPTLTIPTSGTATYDFIPGSATLTTHDSGSDTADGGITSGNIQLDFLLALAFPNFNLEHDGEAFNVQQPSGISFANLPGSATDHMGFYGFATATSPVICSSPCSAELGATFGGNMDPGIGNVPSHIGLVYRVFTGDPFTGAGGFGYSGP